MNVPGRDKIVRYVLAAACFGAAALGFAMLPAHADCGVCQHNPPPPPPHHCNCTPATIVVPPPNVPPPNVPPPNIVVVNAAARASAQASAQSFAISVARTGDTIIHNGGGVYADASAGSVAVSSATFSVVDGAVETSTSTRERTVRVQAICLDDTNAPHPASQTFGGTAVANDYAGEIYRCMSGTHVMRVGTEGRTFDCATGQALWYEHAQVTCKTQIERRPCNERSLLRRFGPGDKVVLLRQTETHAARRETTFNAAMAMDGGVGSGLN